MTRLNDQKNAPRIIYVRALDCVRADDNISLHFTLLRQDGTDGTAEHRSYPVPVLICDGGSSWLGDTQIYVVEDATITPGDLADLLEACIFSPSDDVDDDSWTPAKTLADLVY